MSATYDHAPSGFRCRLGGHEAHLHMDHTASHADLRGSPPWRSIPLWVSNDRAETYFEIYQVSHSPTLSGSHAGEQWRWRLCTPDGHVRAASGAYANAHDCMDAVNALRQSAGTARIRHLKPE